MPGAYRLPEARLEDRFEDKNPPYATGEAKDEAERCLYCVDAPCIQSCPTSIDIPTFIRKIATGNLRGSARTILEANVLGASCARVCPVEVLCEGTCVYQSWGRSPISIGRLQRYAMDSAAAPELLPRAADRSGRSVGLVGAGPASLACGARLALHGHETVVYERDPLPGGLNTTGVAPYKMEAKSSLREVEFVQELGVQIRTGQEIGKDISVDELFQRHEAVFLGPGLGLDTPLAVSGAVGAGVEGAVAWIRRMKTEAGTSLEGVRRAAVIGGGNTALDCVRELRGLGVPEVRLIYRRSENEMSGYRHEWEPAKRDGAVMVPGAIVEAVVRENGKVTGLQLVHAEDGRPTGKPLEILAVDLVLVAIGQAKLRALTGLFEGVEIDERGRIVCDPATGRTGNPRVFAGGDAANGGKEVVNAVDEGQRAAAAIHELLANES